MRQVLILITLILCLSAPAFSQNSTGDAVRVPRLDFPDPEKNPKARVIPAAGKTMNKGLQIRKHNAFTSIDAKSTALFRSVNNNIVSECKDEQVITNYKELFDYLEFRQAAQNAGNLNQFNNKSKLPCEQRESSSCMFTGSGILMLNRLTEEMYLMDYFHEVVGLADADAKTATEYLVRLEKALKTK